MLAFVILILGPACLFLLYVLGQFGREIVQLRSGRGHRTTLVMFSQRMKPWPVETPAVGPVPVIPIWPTNEVAEAIERRAARTSDAA
jgi:hypothetical protein